MWISCFSSWQPYHPAPSTMPQRSDDVPLSTGRKEEKKLQKYYGWTHGFNWSWTWDDVGARMIIPSISTLQSASILYSNQTSVLKRDLINHKVRCVTWQQDCAISLPPARFPSQALLPSRAKLGKRRRREKIYLISEGSDSTRSYGLVCPAEPQSSVFRA